MVLMTLDCGFMNYFVSNFMNFMTLLCNYVSFCYNIMHLFL
ncbi:LOW QUALITY PROTEIN: hypothetical protein TorRG33x02_341310 [Trema orientale]|uniref:Uncharacterized protein n=1 Tax=Trema orientale TaxID=63057 RepID=A0A2P5AU13_TREOI|nr:LOW QUALITY PROTEIN: hypothetical protein TorRG33x02_341310 [Trema orientale]